MKKFSIEKHLMRSLVVFSWLLMSFPLLYVIYLQANLASAYSENIGYRFFWVMRWVDGASNDFIHPGQGVLLPLIQSSYYVILKLFLSNIVDQLLYFSLVTLAIPVFVSLFFLLWMASDKILPIHLRALLVLVLPVVSITHEHLFAYQLYPDYHNYVKLLMLFSFYFYIRNFCFLTPSRRDSVILGLLVALVTSLKINLGVFILALVFFQSGYFFSIFSFIYFYAVIMFLFYGFDYSFYISYFNELFSTTQSWALETNLQQYSPFLSWGSNTYSNLPWLLLVFVIVAVLQLNKGVSPFKILGCFFLATISVYMVFKRGGGASYLDAIVIITLLISLLCAYRPSKRLVLSLVSISLSGIIVWVIAHIDSYGSYKGNLPGMSAGLWQKPLYDWNRVHDLPIIGIFPDNSFVTGTMEDMMMRGFSNFGKPWGDSILNPSKIKLFPKYTLGSTTMTLPDKAVVLWLTSTEPFPLVNKETLDKHNSEINVLLFNKKVGPCYSIIHPIYGPEIRSCVVTN